MMVKENGRGKFAKEKKGNLLIKILTSQIIDGVFEDS